MMPRSLQILPAFEAGGVERATLDWVRYVRSKNAEIFIASAGGRYVAPAQEVGAVHLTLPLATKNPLKIVWNACRLAALIRKHNIQLVHSHSRAPGWSALWASKLTGVPFITTYHGTHGDSNALKRFYNSVMARGQRVITISNYMTGYVAAVYPSCRSVICRIDEGIEVDVYSPDNISEKDVVACREKWSVKPENKVILVPGGFSKRKGQLFALEAFKRLKDPDAVLVFLGNMKKGSAIAHQISQMMEGETRVRFIPYCDNMPVAYAASDMVLSLGMEAFGRVTAEACAMKKLVIGINAGATPEICLHGETGFIVPIGDAESVRLFMERILHMSPEVYEAMATRARAHIVQNYSTERMFGETESLYEEIKVKK